MYTEFRTENQRGGDNFRRPRRPWEYNIKRDFRETECERIRWFEVTRYRVVERAL
jgi:hypothetical protein